MSFLIRAAKMVNALMPFGWRLAHPEALPVESGFSVSQLHAAVRDLSLHLSTVETELVGAAKRFYAALGPDAGLTALHDGHLIYVDPADDQITPHLIMSGTWEPDIEAAVRQGLKPGARVIEVGANLGYYTLIMGGVVGPQGRIDSFEANPRLTALLKRSLRTNGYEDRVTLHQNIVSNRTGTMSFTTSRFQPGGGGISEGGRTWGEDTVHIEAEAVVLDDLFPAETIDFLRIDAEGSELLILEGAMGLIGRSADIQICCEWSMFMMSRRGDPSALARRLEGMGFLFWKLDPRKGRVPITLAQMLDMQHGDVWMSRTALPQPESA
jgi:FkbM family methyltransferase